MAVAAAGAAAPRAVDDGGQAVGAEADHAVDVEAVRVRRAAQRPLAAGPYRRRPGAAQPRA